MLVDAAMNIFARPYQTALSVLSLLKFSGKHIDRVYMQFEPKGSAYDKASPHVVAEYLGDRAVVFQPQFWLECDAAEPSRFSDPAYRLSLRYQHVFECSDKKYLFVLHNDVLVKRDIVGVLLDNIGDAFVIGRLGQCWNCPASNEEVVKAAGCDTRACNPDRYMEFRPDFAGLERLYREAVNSGAAARPYWEGWAEKYSEQAWPLPECRVNEWGCLVDLGQTKPLTMPFGSATPFGAFEACGSVTLDTAVAWFRDLHRAGLHARHMGVDGGLTHWVGNNKLTKRRYHDIEDNARVILEKHFRDFVTWCRERKNGLFV